jgi:hypothetical protein
MAAMRINKQCSVTSSTSLSTRDVGHCNGSAPRTADQRVFKPVTMPYRDVIDWRAASDVPWCLRMYALSFSFRLYSLITSQVVVQLHYVVLVLSHVKKKAALVRWRGASHLPL